MRIIERRSGLTARIRFSLRTLLIAVAVAAVLAGYCAQLLLKSRRDAQLAEQLRTMGCIVATEPEGPFLLRYLFGDDALKRIHVVNLPEVASNDFLKLVARAEFLTSLRAAGTAVTDDGICQLSTSTHLHELILTETQVTSVRCLDNLPLETLDASQTRVTDGLPLGVRVQRTLRRLDLSYTRVTDRGLDKMRECFNLVEVNLSSTAIGDSTVASIVQLPKLEALYLMRTKVTDDAFRSLDLSSSRLLGVDLANTAVGDRAVASLSSCPNLAELCLVNSNVSSDGLKPVRNLTKLTRLLVDGTKVDDAAIAGLVGLKQLSVLTVARTACTAHGIREFQRIRPDVTVVSSFGSSVE